MERAHGSAPGTPALRTDHRFFENSPQRDGEALLTPPSGDGLSPSPGCLHFLKAWPPQSHSTLVSVPSRALASATSSVTKWQSTWALQAVTGREPHPFHSQKLLPAKQPLPQRQVRLVEGHLVTQDKARHYPLSHK